MSYQSFIIIITFIIALTSCSKEEQFKTISVASINFVHEDGSPLALNECINPNTNYAIQIKTNAVGDGIFKTTKVEYTVNGIPYIMSFISDGKQLNPIKLINGYNKAEIVGTSYEAYIYFNSHSNFELVE